MNSLQHAQPPAAHWTLTQDAGGFAWLKLDRVDASTNTLSAAVLEELAVCLDRLASHSGVLGLIIYSGKSNGFIAGADIAEFGGLTDANQTYQRVRQAQQVFDRIEQLPYPSIALLHGFTLGGGLELALACNYRIAAEDRKLSVGLPEVQLGIHPGFGGTVRAPALLGARKALELMLSGRILGASEALKVGLVDALVPFDQLQATAIAYLKASPAKRSARLMDRLLSVRFVRPWLAALMRKSIAQRARPDHYPAPYALLDLWVRFGAFGAQAFEAEARSISQLFTTPTAQNLIRVFFLQNRLKALGSGDCRIESVHVIGAGLMGGDIAAWCAASGLNVTIEDRDPRAVSDALARAKTLFAKKLKSATQAEQACARLRFDDSNQAVARADLVIEAIVENLQAKHALYARIEPWLKADALLATNTSSLSLARLRQGLQQPQRLYGLHFFNPVARMLLIEVVHDSAADETAVQRLISFTRRLDKLGVSCLGRPGFLVNRVLFAYLAESLRLAAEGCAFRAIDQAAVDFGMPQGPFELLDVIGLPIALAVGESLVEDTQAPELNLLRQRIHAGHLGRQSGEGFYRWEHGKVVRGGDRDEYTQDTVDRLVLSLINESVRCLDDQIVADADLLDAALIFGAGFAPFRGGPLHYAKTTGPAKLRQRLLQLARAQGPRFEPARGWDFLEPV